MLNNFKFVIIAGFACVYLKFKNTGKSKLKVYLLGEM